MAQSILKQPQAVLNELGQNYQLDDEEDLLAFLERYPAVLPLLCEIRSNIRRFFGDDPVTLKMSRDLEWPEEDADLIANVETTLSPMEALDRLHAFDNEWWIERLAATRAPLIVSIVLVRRV